MTMLTPASSTDPRAVGVVPTVARSARLARCTRMAPEGWLGRRRCLLYVHSTLDGNALCRRHFAEALDPSAEEGQRIRAEDAAPAIRALTDDYRRRGLLLRQLLDHVNRGIPDPTTGDRVVLAVIPADLIESLQDALSDDRAEGS